MTRRHAVATLCWAGGIRCLAQEHPALARIQANPDLEKRSRLALELASKQLDAATAAYRSDDMEGGRGALALLAESVEVAAAALESTGKHPRRHPRPFKHAEIRTRKLIEELRQARSKAHIQDQGDFDGPIERVERANGALLLGIMSPRK